MLVNYLLLCKKNEKKSKKLFQLAGLLAWFFFNQRVLTFTIKT